MSKGILLIVFAWAMEIVGVAGGVVNSTYTTFGDDLPNTFAGYLPAVPIVVLAVAELGRVPLASVLFHRHKVMQSIALLGIVALGYLAVENWSFGFERIVDLRLKPVNAANRELSRAEAELSALVEQRRQMATNNDQKRNELRRGIDQRDAAIAELSAQVTKEADVHQKNLEEIREACRIIKDKCMVPRSQDEDRRYAAEQKRLSVELTRQREERERLRSQIDDLVSTDASKVAERNQRIGTAEDAVADARQAMHRAIDGNQIYRLAGSWYGVNTSDVTPEQFATARWVFATMSAIAVALAGSVSALVYYARSRVPGAPSFLGGLIAKLARSRRAYYARKRKPLKVEVVGPERVIYRDGKELVEKEVPHYIERDHIVLIPRWGIGTPTYINSLIRPFDRRLDDHSKLDELADATSNVTSLKKAH
jgi:hypothetical protein